MSTETISVSIPGIPIAKPRAKGWFNQKTKQLHHYYPANSGIKGYEQCLRETMQNMFKKPLDGPIELNVIFVFPRPKNMVWKTKPMPREVKLTKPDYDNLLKSVSDALNGIVYRDDGQIWAGGFEKVIADANEIPRTIITLSYEKVEP